MRMRKALVGAGGVSKAWIPYLIQENIEINAVVDIHIESAKRRVEEHHLKATASTDLKEMLLMFKPDFVLDLTPPESHCLVTTTALKHGCHVIGEKPMASSIEEAELMVKTAEETGKMYMVSQSRRWEPNHVLLQHILNEGIIGDLTTVNCDFYIGAHFEGFRDEMRSPLILDMAIHHFDLARFITSTDPISVCAHEFNPKGSWYIGSASAACIFEMSNNVVFNYRGSWCSEGCHTSWNGNWRFIGTKGTIIYEFDRKPYGEIVANNEGFHRQTKPLDLPEGYCSQTAFHASLVQMIKFLHNGNFPRTECRDNIKSFKMAHKALESSTLQTKVII